jgi:hypothetical protein
VKELTMDRAYKRLVEVVKRLRFMIEHWDTLPNTRDMLNETTEELADIVTPGSPEAWRMLAKTNGVTVAEKTEETAE